MYPPGEASTFVEPSVSDEVPVVVGDSSPFSSGSTAPAPTAGALSVVEVRDDSPSSSPVVDVGSCSSSSSPIIEARTDMQSLSFESVVNLSASIPSQGEEEGDV
ncbi:hypothetical protein Adt_39621 [Abeliophyllum distichum]|uniref:Uncharacterized protein n=1 Tax=Abeliophyllum distichum TaxID=126358 RepID=A0ABD1Q5M0_9LAMI